jgi:hypothetical protein
MGWILDDFSGRDICFGGGLGFWKVYKDFPKTKYKNPD